MKLAITPTLLNSFDWYLNCPEDWKKSAYEGVVNTLRRKPFDAGVAAKKGVLFEDAVQRVCEKMARVGATEVNAGSEHFKTVVNHCLGGSFQQWVQFYITHEGASVRGYGKVDVLFPNRVIDLKTTGKQRTRDYYVKGWQPPFYLLATNLPLFSFIVAQWADPDDPENTMLCDVQQFDYKAHDNMSLMVHKKYDQFVTWMKENNLYDDYLYTFCKNPRT